MAMDWKQFISTILVGFAWPSVILVLLYMLRKQIPVLADRIEELTFPGGGKAKFDKKLEEGRDHLERIDPKVRAEGTRTIAPPNDPLLQLAQSFPEAAILEAWREVEGVLMTISPKVKGSSIRVFPNARRIVATLQKGNFIDKSTADLYDSLRAARNSLAHSEAIDRPTPAEALEFCEQARSLANILRKAVEEWKKAPQY